MPEIDREISIRNMTKRLLEDFLKRDDVGYFAGPNVIIIDYNGLSDPLLARLPPKFNKDTWRPGHLSRSIPDGYIESIISGDNKIVDPSLAEYYDKIILITRKPIWNWERFITIYKINTGQYDYFIKDYVARSRQ